jgi:hypothetical protein
MTSFIFEIQHIDKDETVKFSITASTEKAAIRLARLLNPEAKLVTDGTTKVEEYKPGMY